ncbi:Conidial surface nicotinamide adenine dinucleotide glycohydrolase [Trichinella spiralis]|uniref:Conidial surface nicotinamide adenine dinucleotide glycohydrolase n=1 Tax=Trichinella spiralis TaxID=6334 RepID=A0ABR3KAG8_TRISP
MGGIPKSQCQRCARWSWAVSNVLAAGYLLTERSFHTADSCQAVIPYTARCPVQCGNAFLAVTRFFCSN